MVPPVASSTTLGFIRSHSLNPTQRHREHRGHRGTQALVAVSSCRTLRSTEWPDLAFLCVLCVLCASVLGVALDRPRAVEPAPTSHSSTRRTPPPDLPAWHFRPRC